MLPPWDDGLEHQSDFQFAEFLRSLDPVEVRRDMRRFHIPTPHEERLRKAREAERAAARHTQTTRRTTRAREEP